MVQINIGRLIADKIKVKGKIRGHRGLAVGSVKARVRRREQGKLPYSAGEVARWQGVGEEEIKAFLEEGAIFRVNSSNVSMVRFLADENKLIIVYKERRGYEYSNISHAEAVDFTQAISKGMWTWDKLRIRGSKTLHRKPYRRISFSEVDDPKLSDQKVAKGVAGPASKYYPFVHQGKGLVTDDPYVTYARYIAGDQSLIVLFRGGTGREYFNITKEEATQFARAKNKDLWIRQITSGKPYWDLGHK